MHARPVGTKLRWQSEGSAQAERVARAQVLCALGKRTAFASLGTLSRPSLRWRARYVGARVLAGYFCTFLLSFVVPVARTRWPVCRATEFCCKILLLSTSLY